MYGPVAGTGVVPTSWAGALAGTGMDAKASLYRKFPSGAVRWKVTVRASSSTVMAPDRSQGEPVRHWPAPASPEKKERS